jgi:hypothetical protein
MIERIQAQFSARLHATVGPLAIYNIDAKPASLSSKSNDARVTIQQIKDGSHNLHDQ